MLQELISDKDDIALEQSVKEYKDLVNFSRDSANFLVDIQAGEIKFETKIFSKTIIEEKIRNLIKVYCLIKTLAAFLETFQIIQKFAKVKQSVFSY